MATVEKSIEVNVPVRTCYNQWTQFEDFPKFMAGVKRVTRIDDRHLHWKAEVGGQVKEWEAEITLAEPDKAVGWRSIAGAENAGRVNFEPIGPGMTRVTMRIVYNPQGIGEEIGALVGVLGRRVESDLCRFKDFIEGLGRETGAWRTEIHGERVELEPGPVKESIFVSAEPQVLVDKDQAL